MPWYGRILILAGLAAAAGVVILVAAVVREVTTPVEPPASSVVETGPYMPPLTDAEIDRCAACHADTCRHFFETPHSRTLAPATGEEVLTRFTGPDGEGRAVDASLTLFRYVRHEDVLGAEGGRPKTTVRVDWIFGSGTHAQTPVSIQPGTAGPMQGLELHLSWYPGVGLSRTFGHQEEIGPAIHGIGKLEDQETLVECFDCHTTGMKIDATGRPDLTSFETGIRCDKCHEGARQHLETDGETPIARWSKLTAVESIEKCGTCHRTTSSVVARDFAPEDAQLARFAPIGLARSACFTQQAGMRFDCLTCHDPHRPTLSDDAHYVAKCVECHSGAAQSCSDQPLTSNCLPCHMPKRSVDLHLVFTDHWIRIHDEPESDKTAAPPELIDHPLPVEATRP